MSRTTWTGLFAALATVLLTFSALAQGAVTLSPGFRPDPTMAAGVSGGAIRAQGVQQNCRGFISAQANHVLIVPQGFRWLRVYAEAQGDTTLMIRGTMQTWCADDTYGVNPGLDLQGLPPGRYDVYVGSYAMGQSFPYQLTFTESPNVQPGANGGQPNTYQPPNTYRPPNTYQPPNTYRPPNMPPNNGGLTPDATPLNGEIVVPVHFNRPVTANGRSGGSLAGNNVPGRGVCRGFVNAEPDHVMMVPSVQQFLRIFVVSAADTTLIMRQPDGSYLCNDDAYGLNPALQGAYQPGVYQIWVGGYHAGEARPYRITVTDDSNVHP